MRISPARHIRETVTLAKQSKPDTMTRAEGETLP